MHLTVVTHPTPSLRDRSQELDHDLLLSSDIQTLIDNMIPTMYADDGIGLASPQIGQNIRICIVGKDALKLDKKNTLPLEDLILINPVWQKTSRKKEWDTEGCLSVPAVFGQVQRYKDITVTALDRHGHELSFEAHNFFARVIQHEVDHLDGILFIDKAKNLYRNTE